MEIYSRVLLSSTWIKIFLYLAPHFSKQLDPCHLQRFLSEVHFSLAWCIFSEWNIATEFQFSLQVFLTALMIWACGRLLLAMEKYLMVFFWNTQFTSLSLFRAEVINIILMKNEKVSCKHFFHCSEESSGRHYEYTLIYWLPFLFW